ncbi:hypothetical protein, partial [Salmonella sp. s51228]|uniref:hypothetical protein n=1 Tax=Salmonella sp. s51228 TaxID=3159652 RepID=UPI00397F1ABF
MSTLKLTNSESSNELCTQLESVTAENENLYVQLEERTQELEKTKLMLSQKEEEHFRLQEEFSTTKANLTET